MASYDSNTSGDQVSQSGQKTATPKKADIIIRTERDILEAQYDLSAKCQDLDKQIGSAIEDIGKVSRSVTLSARQNEAIYGALSEKYDGVRQDYEGVKKEINLLATQSESIFSALSQSIEALSKNIDDLAKSVDELKSRTAVEDLYIRDSDFEETEKVEEPEQRYTESSVREEEPQETVVRTEIDLDYEEIARKIAEQTDIKVDLDYEEIAKRISEYMPVPETISADYIASKVAEQIVIPESEPKEEETAEGSVREYTEYPATVTANIDEDELADKIALRLGNLRDAEFDIIVDDEGCDTLADRICDKLDYDRISSAVADKISQVVDVEEEEGDKIDTEELATKVAEKISVPAIDEEALAKNVAESVGEYISDTSADDIADKVSEQLADVIGKTDDRDYIVSELSKKAEDVKDEAVKEIAAIQAEHEYDLVIDDDGVAEIAQRISSDERFDRVDREIEELKEMLQSGEYVVKEEPQEERVVTVSEVVNEGYESAPEPTEEEKVVIEQIIKTIDEPAKAKPAPDYSNVDFVNMMRYNRSFIARIIQGSDEQKSYYGQVRDSLLAYGKVNSNISWTSERFHKGKETVARFKIRGKTLCLYLNLNPKDYPISVYHQTDVSNNKSMKGTPMMVKITSGRGAQKAARLVDEMMAKRDAVKRNIPERDYVAMYPYETMEELIAEGLVKDIGDK